jgi:hypothetical protein
VESYGVEPMCGVLRIAPSTWQDNARRMAEPDLRSAPAKEDERLSGEIIRVHARNFGVYAQRRLGCSTTGRASRSRATVWPG